MSRPPWTVEVEAHLAEADRLQNSGAHEASLRVIDATLAALDERDPGAKYAGLRIETLSLRVNAVCRRQTPQVLAVCERWITEAFELVGGVDDVRRRTAAAL